MPLAPRTPDWIKDSHSDQLDSFFKPVDSLSLGTWHAALSSHRYTTPHMIPGAPRMDLRFVFTTFPLAGICLRHPTANRDYHQVGSGDWLGRRRSRAASDTHIYHLPLGLYIPRPPTRQLHPNSHPSVGSRYSAGSPPLHVVHRHDLEAVPQASNIPASCLMRSCISNDNLEAIQEFDCVLTRRSAV
ncbi:hypothetical protein KC363_g131 [Hortaea werneckii]|nr:hypothetical protein KC363_g131 [Hortaea werneckii]